MVARPVSPQPVPEAKRGRFDVAWEPVPLHFKIPHGIFLQEATSVAVDSSGNVYCFNRGNMPVLVFNEHGDLLRHWGNPTPFEGTLSYTDPYGNVSARFKGTQFARPHSVTIDHADNVWLVDDMANVITKCTGTGERLMMLLPNGKVLTDPGDMADAAGKIFEPPTKHSNIRFNRPTDIAVHPTTGDLFVTDGYGNSAVHHLKANGELVKSWGAPGTEPGEFNLPHSITLHLESETLLVADRENSRVQFFGLDGSFKQQWHVHRAVGVSLCTIHDKVYVLAAQQPSLSRVQRGRGLMSSALESWTPNIGNCIAVYELAGNGTRLLRIGASVPGERPDQFIFPHMLASNAKGDIYCAEVSFCECGKFQEPHAREMVSLRKWRRIASAES